MPTHTQSLAEAKLLKLRRLQELQDELKRLREQDDAVVKPKWEDIARPDQLAPPGDWSVWAIIAGRGWGKAAALNTLVPVPSGWKTLEEIQPGDEVFDESGRVCNVTNTFNVQPERAYRVTFSDNTYIDACSEHQWVTWTGLDRKALYSELNGQRTGFPDEWPDWHHGDRGPAIRTTEEIASTIMYGKGVNHSIPSCGTLQLPDADLPLDPYVLGVWLGDGSHGGPCFSSMDDEIVENVRAAGMDVREVGMPKSLAHNYAFNFADGRKVRGVLTKMGVRLNKHVPDMYMRASAAQRLSLLQGLMDTDGASDGGRVGIAQKRKIIADAVAELARSLGQHVTRRTAYKKLNGELHGPYYIVSWRATIPVFRLTRKLSLIVPFDRPQAMRYHQRFIQSAKEINPVPMKCLTVDSKHSMFLIGEAMIPTHNSRTAAEWAAAKARQYPGSRVALVGKSFADVRDTMIEGESGLLACFNTDEFLHGREDDGYNRSRLRVQLANGSIFASFSAEKPWRLRGPQHHFCFPADTMIRVPSGEVPIQHIVQGDLVMTRNGPRRVIWVGSRIAPLVTVQHQNGELTGTSDHPVMTARGWVALSKAHFGDMLVTWENSLAGQICEYHQKWWTSTISDGIKMPAVTGTGVRVPVQINEIVVKCGVTANTGHALTGLSQLDTSSIIKITSPVMTALRTLSHSRHSSISNIMQVNSSYGFVNYVEMNSRYQLSAALRDSVNRVGRHEDVSVSDRACVSSCLNALIAENRSLQSPAQQGINTASIAVSRAQITHVQTDGSKKAEKVSSHCTCARSVSKSSEVIRTGYSAVRVAPIEHELSGRVYNIQVEGESEYFANGILVHNCWADESCYWQDAHKGLIADTTWSNMMITLRLPKKPQWDEDYKPQVVVATTPRPVALLRTSDPDPSRVGILQRPTTVITRGRTMDNIENLSKSYKENVIDPLLGTRLGRQELEAEILDDVPGALWKREWFEETRITDPSLVPDLIRVLVGVDPSVTDGESSAQTGIIVAGAAKNGRGYVLGDFTLRATPMETMQKVVAIYHEFSADRVIAEVNNGGDYIGTLLKTVDPNIPFQSVRATRGKAIRAEPVSSLYEQRRISHLGSLSYLEDQCCSWTPSDTESPDRIDALVWCITGLKDLIGGSFLAAYGVTKCESCQHAFTAKDPGTGQPRTTCPKCGAPVELQ